MTFDLTETTFINAKTLEQSEENFEVEVEITGI